MCLISVVCSAEVLSPCERAARLQMSEILEDSEQGANCCYTLQGVEKVMKKVRACASTLVILVTHCEKNEKKQMSVFLILLYLATLRLTVSDG